MTAVSLWKFPFAQVNAAHRARIDGHEDIVPNSIEAWREGEDGPFWTVFVMQGSEEFPQRDTMLYAAQVMAEVTACDYLVLAYDTHATTLPLNPKTGKPWGPGEMQRMCDEEGFCDTGQMRDTLVVMVVRRSDQKIHSHNIPYHFHGDGRLMFFPEETLSEWTGLHDGLTLGGYIPDRLRSILAAPTIMEAMKAQDVGAEALGFDLSDTEDLTRVRTHMVMAGVRVLANAAHQMGLPQVYANIVPVRNEIEHEVVQGSVAANGLKSETIKPSVMQS